MMKDDKITVTRNDLRVSTRVVTSLTPEQDRGRTARRHLDSALSFAISNFRHIMRMRIPSIVYKSLRRPWIHLKEVTFLCSSKNDHSHCANILSSTIWFKFNCKMCFWDNYTYMTSQSLASPLQRRRVWSHRKYWIVGVKRNYRS